MIEEQYNKQKSREGLAEVIKSNPSLFGVEEIGKLIARGNSSPLLSLVAIDHAVELMKGSRSRIPELKPFDLVNETKDLSTFRRGKLRNVIVEEVQCADLSTEKSTTAVLFDLMENVVNLPQPLDFRALNCSGIYHDLGNKVFGLVSDSPDTAVGARGDVFQLVELQLMP
jgi:hypothetical protein